MIRIHSRGIIWVFCATLQPGQTQAQYPPGFWRGIYTYFYDTDRPNTNPWEMFGFTERAILVE